MVSSDGIDWKTINTETDDVANNRNKRWKALGGGPPRKDIFSKHTFWDTRQWGLLSDKTSFAYNPFIDKWVFAVCTNLAGYIRSYGLQFFDDHGSWQKNNRSFPSL